MAQAAWEDFVDDYMRVAHVTEKLFGMQLDKAKQAQDLDNFMKLREILLQHRLVDDTVLLLNKEIKEKKRILVEDASSSSMDVDAGLYPYTDGYHTTTGAVCTGLGVPEEAIETTIGVFSAVSAIRKDLFAAERLREFPTRISKEDPEFAGIEGRFASEYELFGDDYAFGWTDLNLIRHAETVNKLDSIMLTHLDVLNEAETIKICKRYVPSDDSEDKTIFENSLPSNIETWENLTPEFIELPGW